jgi:hypothetical protein
MGQVKGKQNVSTSNHQINSTIIAIKGMIPAIDMKMRRSSSRPPWPFRLPMENLLLQHKIL